MPSPDSVTTAITTPAAAQAIATDSAFLAPSTQAAIRFETSHSGASICAAAATGKQASTPASAAIGALKPEYMTTRIASTGRNM